MLKETLVYQKRKESENEQWNSCRAKHSAGNMGKKMCNTQRGIYEKEV